MAGFKIRQSNLRAQLAFISEVVGQLRRQAETSTAAYRTQPAEREQRQQDN